MNTLELFGQKSEKINRPVLRDYQLNAVESILSELEEKKSTLLVMPTGSGKTVTYSEVITAFYPAKKVLVLAHRIELLTQAKKTLVEKFGISERDIQIIGGAYGNIKTPLVSAAKIILASKDSLQGKSLERWNKEDFSLIVIDESHHSVAPTYRNILEYFYSAKRLGVTATPDRLDGKGLGEIFESVAFVYEIRDAIENGYLVPVKQKFVDVNTIDLTNIKTIMGDFSERDLSEMLCEEKTLHKMILPTIEIAEDRKTLIFACTIDHAKEIERVGNYYKKDAFLSISGNDDHITRKWKMKEFERGDTQFLINRDLITEGVDIPKVSCVAMFRPTKSRALYSQIIGRGMRLLGNDYAESLLNGKSDLLVIDYVGNSKNHSLISTMDCLDGKKNDEVRERAEKIIREKGIDTLNAIYAAEFEITQENQKKVIFKAANYKIEEIDPFIVLNVYPQTGRFGGLGVTEKQRNLLLDCGILESDISSMDRGQASEIIDEIIERRRLGMATFKQSKLLLKMGCNPNLLAKDASDLITKISLNKWKVTQEIRDVSERLAVRKP